MFTIIIPNYNNASWLDQMFESIYKQTYDGYSIVFVDDCSTDNSVEIAYKWRDKFNELPGWYGDFEIIENGRKRWNGGSRNVGLESDTTLIGTYVLFLDSDDYFADEHCLEEIVGVIEANNYPDLIRLSYIVKDANGEYLSDLGDQDTVEKIVSNQNVACWTKCVKTNKVVEFSENTLMEDVVQHIKQLDSVETIATTHKGIVVWNRLNENSCSRNQELQNGKWRSSLYRHYADLLDLQVSKPECQAELERRRAIALDNIKNDRFEQ